MKTTRTSPQQLSRREFIGAVAATFATSCATNNAASGGGYQIGCYTRPWGAHDWRVALDAIAEAGYRYCGLMTTKAPQRLVISATMPLEEAAQVGEECRKRGLTPVSVYGGGFTLKTPAEAVEGLKRLIDNVAAARSVNLLLGGTDAKGFDVYYGAVAECCDYAAQKGIGISIKPHGGANANGAECRKIIEKIGHKNFRIWYDPGNIYFYSNGNLDPVKDAAGVADLVVGMCVKDWRPANPPPAKKHPLGYGGEVSLTPGTGRVNFKAVLETLKKGGFTRGALIVECLTGTELPALLAEAKKARVFLEKLTGQKA